MVRESISVKRGEKKRAHKEEAQADVPVDSNAGFCPGDLPRCGGCLRPDVQRTFLRRKTSRILIPLAVLCVLAVLFVGLDVAERHILPNLSIGLHHALLTLWAGIVTSGGMAIVYLLMRRQQRWLSATAERLTCLLESYQLNRSAHVHFENPHLVHCRQVKDCDRKECPMYDAPGERCWQVMALSRTMRDPRTSGTEIQECHECAVYRLSCPDKLTELGESFNNLIFLLEEEAEQLGQMQAQMVEKEKMVAVGQIAAGIAHEVGNPLSSISSIVQMMKRSRSNGAMTEQLDLIEIHIQRISVIVRQLVSLARPGPDRWELVSISDALEEVVRLVGFDRRARNVDITFKPAKSLPLTYGLQGQLQQVFINLSLNALDAMDKGGKLTIYAQRKLGKIMVHIEDTGCGIEPEAGRRIFEPFFTTKQPGQGTGLGLAVSYSIIQKHGGTIDFHSTIGNGTTFIVEIPVLDNPPEEHNGSGYRSAGG